MSLKYEFSEKIYKQFFSELNEKYIVNTVFHIFILSTFCRAILSGFVKKRTLFLDLFLMVIIFLQKLSVLYKIEKKRTTVIIRILILINISQY